VWYPKHHLKAAKKARFFDSHDMPVVTFMDTPGAAADVEANLHNQSHSISFFIAEMANLAVPTVGVVFGHGYSGGAIPLASTNILLSVKDSVFNTIHPKGLSNIARKYNLSWQECAQYTGISPYELKNMGYLDGVIDYTPRHPKQLANLRLAIFSAINCVEKNAQIFLKQNDFFFQHYQENIEHFLNPSEMLIEDNRITDKSPTGILNIFGSVYRFLRYLKLRNKIQSQSIFHYSRLSKAQIPKGSLQERLSLERVDKFQKWLKTPLEIRYHEELYKKYKRFVETAQSKEQERSKIATLLIGSPQENFEKARQELTFSVLMYLYNHWKGDAQDNLLQLYDHLANAPQTNVQQIKNPSLLDLLSDTAIHETFEEDFHHIILFDLLYDGIIESLPMIAGELKGKNEISRQSVEKLFDAGLEKAMQGFEKHSIPLKSQDVEEQFFQWLIEFGQNKSCDSILHTITNWKQVMFPRISPPLFGIARYYFSTLFPSWYAAEHKKKKFQGKISPRNIGIKDFWNRLDQAYKDLLIQNLLRNYKKQHITPDDIINKYFTDFKELFDSYMTSDPVQFPGFRTSIEQALNKGVTPCGVITGMAKYIDEKSNISTKVGLVVSNTQFQAGAFDMASCEKVCKLLVECARLKLPVIMFISSGGMQTKEGAGALFSMAVVNDRITRFVKDRDLPIICFGFRDCMGGAQASFVTHRLVKSYYLSGTLMSFAGQLVVESHLTTNSILSNYLSTKDGSMEGLVQNPFDSDMDQRLSEIDPKIPTAEVSVQEVITKILSGEYQPARQTEESEGDLFNESLDLKPIKRLLIHARGCTAARLIQAAHDQDREVILVQSDADMDSYPAQTLNEKDRLICIGGNTPQESYLNAMSVIRIAEQEKADSIHPGIGFLSETPSYAKICREHEFNFIGPRAASMDLMGNKSNAIATAKRLNIPVVPGSEGALTDADQAQGTAEEIGFPVLIKSAHGGGGKGICVVRQPEQFRKIFAQMSQEAFNAFGNGDLYLEKYIESMRHLEVQVLRDSHGNTKLVGIRDCSVQRNFQKLIEESTDFEIDQKIKDELYQYSQNLVDDIDYLGAGTVEFIYDRTDQRVYFMEMNTRLQVEHPVTEMVVGTDLVHQQFAIAEGESIKKEVFKPKGHAIELRINAEKIDDSNLENLQFLPDPGKITEIALPNEENIRVLSAITQNSSIPPYYDSLVAQIIAWGKDRKEAIQRLLNYLTQVKIHGVCTNLATMEEILKDPVFQSGDYDTHFIEGFFERVPAKKLIDQTNEYAGSSGVSIDKESISIPDSKELKVLSPQTGSFYRSNSPDEPPFIEEGQMIESGQILCLMESMKIFKELTLESYKNSDGKFLYDHAPKFQIKRVLAEDQQTVSKGDLLFIMEPVVEEKEEVSS
jgi:acetyl/propionyl-CoA carboxylase alpha subunit/acetyl-CoA carboxylase alpha subunit